MILTGFLKKSNQIKKGIYKKRFLQSKAGRFYILTVVMKLQTLAFPSVQSSAH